ncbi:Hypothetical protein GLP15_3142 [Giardia lamblia P15]|uniref:Uncharacterized protein n=1 Tax=Giardia intestinalis (strain P15) TaxID=658858 RepID=E1EVR8_GIAIA|nr:Hypothetical protein GLP15_3142 [Giardia lamblia P15]
MEKDRLQNKSTPHVVIMKHNASSSFHNSRRVIPGPPRSIAPVNLQTLKRIASNASSTIPPPLDSYVLKAEQVKSLAHMCPKLFELGNRSVVPISKVKVISAYNTTPYDQRADDISILVAVAHENLSYYRRINLLVLVLNMVSNVSQYLHEWIANDYVQYIKKKKKAGDTRIKSIYDPAKQSTADLIRDPEYLPDMLRFFNEHKKHKPELYNSTISILSDCFSDAASEPSSILESIINTPIDSSTTSIPSENSSLSSLSDLSMASVSAELQRRKTMRESVSMATNSLSEGYKQMELKALKQILQTTFSCQRIIPLVDIERQLKRKHPKVNALKLLRDLADTTTCITISQGDVSIDWAKANF